MSRSRHDIAIIGGGIAGLAIAELFARSGRSTILIERNELLCQEASASQHGWFHFGSLYSIFPQNHFLRTMISGVEDLLAYYSSFSRMNIRVTAAGQLAFPQVDGAWFRDEPIEYIVSARNDPDFDMWSFGGVRAYARKTFFLLVWEMAIKQFISRHQRFHQHDWSSARAASQWIPKAGLGDYSRDVITKPFHPDVNLDRDTHFRIVGYDRPMRSTAIITDLARSLIGAGGEILVGDGVDRIEKSERGSLVHTYGGQTIEAGTVIATAGKWLGQFLPRAEDIKVIASPLLVAYPAVAKRNFVRLTPFVERSVNHLCHEIEGRVYSLIGGGYFADPTDPDALARATERLIEMARSVFPALDRAEIIESYLGYKTEIASDGGKRNYHYLIRQISDGVYAAIPGKFSLAFSLAANSFRQVTGEEPANRNALADPGAARAFVGPTRHGAILLNAWAASDKVLLRQGGSA